MPKFPDKLYVPQDYDHYARVDWGELSFSDEAYVNNNYVPGRRFAYTISSSPEAQGWENDAGCDNYGLPKELAEEIVRRYNAFEEKK